MFPSARENFTGVESKFCIFCLDETTVTIHCYWSNVTSFKMFAVTL